LHVSDNFQNGLIDGHVIFKCDGCLFFFFKLLGCYDLHVYHSRAASSFLMTCCIAFVFVAKLALFTINLVLIGSISSKIVNPFSKIVLPVSTISTMTSAMPISGANSTEPFNLIVSTWI